MKTIEEIPGYDFGKPDIATSPISELELKQLEQAVGWTSDDADVLSRSGQYFRDRAETMVDSWRKVIGVQPHLAQWFKKPDGQPDDDYKARVKRRFVQWVVDVAIRPHNPDWLNYQFEIGLRHTPAKKNITDNAHTPPVVPFRYLVGFIPVVLPIRSFFTDVISDVNELERLQAAWTKAVVLHVALWSHAYVSADLW
jgi:protoglobin